MANHPDTSITTHFNRSQTEVFGKNKERYRKLNTIKQIPWLVAGVKNSLQPRDQVREEQELRSKLNALEVALYNAFQNEKAGLVEKAVGMKSPEDLMGMALRKLGEERAELNRLLRALVGDRDRIEKEQATLVEYKPPKKIAIIGLKPNQQRMIENSYRHRIDLRFIEANTSKTNLPKGVDTTILMTKFIDHKWQDAARCQSSNGFEFCNGGISALKGILKRYV